MARQGNGRRNSVKNLPMALGNRRTAEIRNVIKIFGPKASNAKVAANLQAKGLDVSTSEVAAVKRAELARQDGAQGGKKQPARGRTEAMKPAAKRSASRASNRGEDSASAGGRRTATANRQPGGKALPRSSNKTNARSSRDATADLVGRVRRGLSTPHA